MNFKPILSAIICAILSFSGFAQNKTIIIEGNIKNIPNDSVVSLSLGSGNVFMDVAKDTIVDGKFKFEYPLNSNVKLPANFSLRILGSPNAEYQMFWAMDGLTTITGTGSSTTKWMIENRCQANIESNKLKVSYSQYALVLDRINKSMDSCRQITPRPQIYESIIKEREGVYDLIQIDELKYLSSVGALTESGLDAINSIALFGLKHGRGLESYRKQIEEVYGKLTPDQQQTIKGQTIKEILFPKPKLNVGDTLPDDLLKDPEGNTHKLSDYRGKYIIVEIWGAFCSGCVESLSELTKIQAKNKDNLTVIGVNSDNSEMWKMGTEMHKVSIINLSDGLGSDAGFSANFMFDMIPYYIIADADGKILKLGFFDIEKELSDVQ